MDMLKISFSRLSEMSLENQVFPIPDRRTDKRTDISNYRVALVLKIYP